MLWLDQDGHGASVHDTVTGVTVEWRQVAPRSLLSRVPAVDLRMPSVNSTITVKLVERPRWILWLSGPAAGPAVGMWAVLAFVVLASLALVRTRLTPLRVRQFVLLGLGLTLTWADPFVSLLVVGGWLAAGWRARVRPSEAHPLLCDAGQIALIALLAVSLGVCLHVVDLGLRQPAQCYIVGNGGAPSTTLSWFQDRASPVLAQPSVLSLPIWVYRASFLAWTLWLVVSLFRWSPWLSSCLKQHGLWRSTREPFAPPPSEG